MKNIIFKTPEGFNDILNKECKKRVEVEDSIRRIFNSYSFLEVDTPTLEYYDLFHGNIDTLSQERMFKLIDTKGNILVLRPDITVPIMRMAVTKFNEDSLPLRVSYFGNVFRNDIKNLLNCEYRQAGIEILGSSSVYADAEIILIAAKALIENGIDDFRIDIGQVKLFKALTSELDEDIKEEIRQAVSNKDKYSIQKLLVGIDMKEDKKQALINLPFVFGSCETLDKIESEYKNIDGLQDAVEELKELINILKTYNLEKYIAIDAGMVQSLDYYSGIIFRFYTADCGFSICWGGRYNYLSQNFNKSINATGCAIGINRIIEVLEKKQSNLKQNGADFFITTSKKALDNIKYKISEILIGKGYKVENDIIFNDENIKNYCIYKRNKKIIHIIDEYKFKVIDIENNNEIEYNIEDLYGWEKK